MLGTILFVIIAYVAYKTNPKKSKFSRFFNPGTQITDYIFFSISQSRNETSIGIFNNWFKIPVTSDAKHATLDEIASQTKAESEREQGNKAKINKDYSSAGELYQRAAISFGNTDYMESASCYEEAFKAYKQGNNSKARIFLEKAINLYENHDKKSSRAAKLYETLGQFIEESKVDLIGAMKAFIKAGELFEREGQTSRLFACLMKIAEIQATLGNFNAAIETFKRLIVASQYASYLQFRLKEFLFSIQLCTLANNGGDLIGVEKIIDEHLNAFPTYKNTNEFKLISKLLQAIKNYEEEDWNSCFTEYLQLFGRGWKANVIKESEKLIKDLT
jgi:alpha-soluble NSF attachment protein